MGKLRLDANRCAQCLKAQSYKSIFDLALARSVSAKCLSTRLTLSMGVVLLTSRELFTALLSLAQNGVFEGPWLFV